MLRDERGLCGHDDASLTAANPYPDRPTYQGPDPKLAALDWYYTGAIHQHLLGTLGVESDLDYARLNMEVNSKWKDERRKHVFEKTQGAMDDLRLRDVPQVSLCFSRTPQSFPRPRSTTHCPACVRVSDRGVV